MEFVKLLNIDYDIGYEYDGKNQFIQQSVLERSRC